VISSRRKAKLPAGVAFGSATASGAPRPGAPRARDQVKEILDRVLTWPAERQADVAHMVEMMEAQDNSGLRLSDEQVAEVNRRVADPNPTFLTLGQVRERFAHRRA
jgi:hypothetical protein